MKLSVLMCVVALATTHARGADETPSQSVSHAAAAWIDRLLEASPEHAVAASNAEREKPEQQPSRRPFSFVYDGQRSDALLDAWPVERKIAKPDADRTCISTVWTDPKTGLRVDWEAVRFADFPAVEWVFWFENRGTADTPILEDVQALDLNFQPAGPDAAFRLHRTNGAPANPTDFEPSVLPIDADHSVEMAGGGGRSSNRDFPFFKIEADSRPAGDTSLIVAVGWSGQWHAAVAAPRKDRLHLRAGQERTHFVLHPKEKVRSPRMLLLYATGDTLDSNAQFRQLIYKHYAARRAGNAPMPTLFCNTAFTRGGEWLNECNAENQVSLIEAYAPLGLEALITDAGWFEGGWPAGAGNWTPRRDAYPHGFAPVAAAAKAHGMVYGLWFEPERVVAGTELDKRHPDWVLHHSPNETNHLANFGLPQVQDYFFQIVKGYMDLPGFRFYRQDFNMDPLDYWRANDAADRQGITENHYVVGLYAYWDRIAATWPDGYREECASGGRRIDLETVMRMPLHQDSDHWFDDDANQAATWGISQYLPNNVVTMPLNRIDDYSFRSMMASSMCMGWIADAKDFDVARGKHLLQRYKDLRRLLISAWYPLLPYSRSPRDWMAYQFHRPDLNEGMVLSFRHAESSVDAMELALHGLDPAAAYEVKYENSEQAKRLSGAELAKGLRVVCSKPRTSELIVYRKLDR